MVRISGPRAFEAISSLVRTSNFAQAAPRKLTRARLLSSSGAEIDDALFAKFISPDSYTGEDIVELHLHGGAYIASRVMEELLQQGIRQALPGEFSFRGVRNGKMSLSQAQAVADLIAASNDGALALALEKMSGTQNRLISSIASDLRDLVVLSEAGIDFADQDIDEVSLEALNRKLIPLITSIDHLAHSYDRGSRIQDGLRVAFVGLPNAGKSSFFNALLGEDRSIVSEIAGTTRDIVREKITLRGERTTITLRLEDTAGLRSSHDPIEKVGIERSHKAAREADLVVLVVDPFEEFSSISNQWEALGSPATKTIGVTTKLDLNPAKLQGSLGIKTWVETSAITGVGIHEAALAITSYCEERLHRSAGEVLLTRQDHLEAVRAAREHLIRSTTALEHSLFAADLRQSLRALEPLIGETLADDILGRIFSDFCIGK